MEKKFNLRTERGKYLYKELHPGVTVTYEISKEQPALRMTHPEDVFLVPNTLTITGKATDAEFDEVRQQYLYDGFADFLPHHQIVHRKLFVFGDVPAASSVGYLRAAELTIRKTLSFGLPKIEVSVIDVHGVRALLALKDTTQLRILREMTTKWSSIPMKNMLIRVSLASPFTHESWDRPRAYCMCSRIEIPLDTFIEEVQKNPPP
jgi:hypothetical protein